MKRYSLLIVLHIVLISVFSVAGYVFIRQQLWFSTLICVLFLVGTGISLYNLQIKHIGIMKRLTESIRFNDLTQTFPVIVKNKVVQEMAADLSDALRQLKDRLLEEEIRHQYYENLLEKVDTAVLVTDRSGRVEWMNRAARLLIKDRSQIPDILAGISNTETQIIRSGTEGHIQEMAVSCTSFYAQSKERLLISLKDIHSVLEKNEMEAWQKLIRVLTHEIMNSITPIISLSETISERAVSPELSERDYKVMHQAMQTIHRRSKGLLDFVENYRRLTRLPAPIPVRIPLDELFMDLRKLFPDSNISFEIKKPDLVITADRSQVEQVLINLIKNAAEATSGITSPDISVSAGRSNQQVIIRVADNGTGILPEVMDKIFVPFFTTKQSGSGIGLSLCKQIMNQHNGRISAESETGKGSVFKLIFPASDSYLQ